MATIVQVDPAHAKMNDSYSMDEIGWFTFDTMPKPLHSSVKRQLQMHKEYFAPFAVTNVID